MTEDNGKNTTLSGKSTLTLKLGSKHQPSDGKKMVQVEVRKKELSDKIKFLSPKHHKLMRKQRLN